jgi:ribosome-binding factor A
MLAGKRAVRVGEQIQKEISYLLLETVKDPRVKGVTVTGIKLSNDLKRARVFFSVIGEQDQIKKAQAGLDSAKGFIKREIGLRMSLKYTPEIIFVYDPSLESGSYMERLFEKLKNNESENGAE